MRRHQRIRVNERLAVEVLEDRRLLSGITASGSSSAAPPPQRPFLSPQAFEGGVTLPPRPSSTLLSTADVALSLPAPSAGPTIDPGTALTQQTLATAVPAAGAGTLFDRAPASLSTATNAAAADSGQPPPSQSIAASGSSADAMPAGKNPERRLEVGSSSESGSAGSSAHDGVGQPSPARQLKSALDEGAVTGTGISSKQSFAGDTTHADSSGSVGGVLGTTASEAVPAVPPTSPQPHQVTRSPVTDSKPAASESPAGAEANSRLVTEAGRFEGVVTAAPPSPSSGERPALPTAGAGDGVRTPHGNDRRVGYGPVTQPDASNVVLAAAHDPVREESEESAQPLGELAAAAEAVADAFAPQTVGLHTRLSVLDLPGLDVGLERLPGQVSQIVGILTGSPTGLVLTSCAVAAAAGAVGCEVVRRQTHRPVPRIVWPGVGDGVPPSWFLG
jgi:hypothetical protein